MKRAVFYLMILTVMGAFTGCSAKVTVSARSDLKTDISLRMDAGSNIEKTLNALTGGVKVSEDSITKSFEGSDFSDVKVSAPSIRNINVSGTLCAPDQQRKDMSVNSANFVECQKNRLTVTLSAQTLQQLARSWPEETQLYLNLLMAPVFTGEKMGSEEYLSLIAAIYGTETADDIKKASIDFTLKAPSGKKIKSASLGARKGKTTGSQAEVSIPLVEFLTLTGTEVYTIQW